MDFPIRVPAIKVHQPFGDFYITKLPAKLLLQVTYKDPLRVREKFNDTYSIVGKQRQQKIQRLKEIGEYINSVDAAFPNSIILSANFYEKGTSVTEEKIRWKIDKKSNNSCLELLIPTDTKVASIIDGQHRVDAFNYSDEAMKDMELLCAVYLDIPETYQAYLFATINYNQKPVPKALAYELFGASLEDEPSESWSPEKTAIFLTRKLNVNDDSPLKSHIVVAAQQDDLIEDKKLNIDDWGVSTATIVDGIMKLYSQNPKKDKSLMHSTAIDSGRNRKHLPDDKTPFRKIYKEGNDIVIYKTVANYFSAVSDILFVRSNSSSYIKKTVGIQALFEVLKEILIREFYRERDIREEYFSHFIGKVSHIDFSDPFYQASGVGKSRIRNTIMLAFGFIEFRDIKKDNEIELYQRILENGKTV